MVFISACQWGLFSGNVQRSALWLAPSLTRNPCKMPNIVVGILSWYVFVFRYISHLKLRSMFQGGTNFYKNDWVGRLVINLKGLGHWAVVCNQVLYVSKYSNMTSCFGYLRVLVCLLPLLSLPRWLASPAHSITRSSFKINVFEGDTAQYVQVSHDLINFNDTHLFSLTAWLHDVHFSTRLLRLSNPSHQVPDCTDTHSMHQLRVLEHVFFLIHSSLQLEY